MSGEQAYQRLQKAKKLNNLVNISPDPVLKLSPDMSDAYLREIVESGGAPSIHEIQMVANSLGGFGYEEESLAKRGVNYMASLHN